MAIYFEKLFCTEGQKLRIKKDIVFEEQVLGKIGEWAEVIAIIGYGFDIRIPKTDIEIRLMNSQMSEYFEPADDTFLSEEGKRKKRMERMKRELENRVFDIIVFAKDLQIGNHTVIKGEKFILKYIGEEYSDLLDVTTFEKVLRLSKDELKKYCRYQNELIEEFS